MWDSSQTCTHVRAHTRARVHTHTHTHTHAHLSLVWPVLLDTLYHCVFSLKEHLTTYLLCVLCLCIVLQCT